MCSIYTVHTNPFLQYKEKKEETHTFCASYSKFYNKYDDDDDILYLFRHQRVMYMFCFNIHRSGEVEQKRNTLRNWGYPFVDKLLFVLTLCVICLWMSALVCRPAFTAPRHHICYICVLYGLVVIIISLWRWGWCRWVRLLWWHGIVVTACGDWHIRANT